MTKTCVWENTLWESDRFLAYALHSLTSIEIPLHCFGAYLIIFKTPKSMKSAKASILQLHILCSIMDITITSLWTYYLWIPCPAGYPVGLMSTIGIDSTLQSLIALTVMLAVAISYVSLFENRYDVVMQPCIPMELINHPNFMDLNAGSYTIPFVSGTMVVIICIQAVYFLGYTTYCLFTNVQNVSNHTRKVQKKFFLAMFLQAAIPAVSFAAPLYGYSLLWKFDYFYQMYNNLLMIAIGCNGLFSTVAMILVHHPYRNAALDMIRMRKLNGFNSVVGTLNLRPIITEKNLVVVSG
ncbi:hypothetical protein CAEBREN_18671 [Caenorhabditis brenneri]|uniref:Uncharacterized protein n=1 Tax=Caenorhabditis brenneri TaxID=135651 RepID=G0MG08_CAEBE|nr:hypothetical protein CAEBREN_18671 [Caenorhabditis brenneri]